MPKTKKKKDFPPLYNAVCQRCHGSFHLTNIVCHSVMVNKNL